jgi:O-antigen/teichoic acid export membrane protein
MVLAFARISNYGILLVSPILFVRILDQHAYGQYREFVVYALALATILGFSVKTSILYFIPRDPDNERKYLTQTALFIFATSTLGLGVVYAARHVVLAKASFDFALPLSLYVFFFLNLDFVESYWLAKKRSNYVLYYSTAKSAIKITLSMAVAYSTRSVEAIIATLVAFEVCKFLILLAWFLIRRLFTMSLDADLIREHLRLVLPFGAGTVLYNLNQQLGKLFTSMALGPGALAIYTIGAYQIPIMGVVRSAAADILFPDMVQRGKADPMAGLTLWNRANVLYCFVVFPVFTLLFFYADVFVTTLFTDQYIAAVPIFRVCLLMMLRQCFETSTPLRAMNENRYFLIGNSIAIAVNSTFIYAAFDSLGLMAAPLGLLASELFLVLFMATRVLKVYSIRLREMLLWRKLMTLALAIAWNLPILLIGEWVPMGDTIRAMVFSSLFITGFLVVVRLYRIDEVDLVIARTLRRVRVRGWLKNACP